MVFFRSFGPCEYEPQNRPIAFATGSDKVRAIVTFPKGRHSIFYPRGTRRVLTKYTREFVPRSAREAEGRQAVKQKVVSMPPPKYNPQTDPREIGRRMVLLQRLREYDPSVTGLRPEYNPETGKLEGLRVLREP
jgi:hypothetical protein